MSVPGLGHKSSLLIAKESSYGVAPATATAKYEIENFRWSANLSAVADPNMNTSGMSARSIVPGLQFVTGSFRIRVGFEGFEELWRFVMPGYTSALVAALTARDHTFKEAAALASYTLDLSEGDVPTGKATRFTGCYVTNFRFNLVQGTGAGAVTVADVDFVAEDVAENTTPMGGTPAVTNLISVPFHMALRSTGNLLDGSGVAPGSIYLRSFGLTLSIPHDSQRGYLGSVWANAPVRNGPLAATMEFEAEWDASSYALMTLILANAPATGLKILFQHPTVIEGASTKRELEFIANSPCAAGYDHEIPGFGTITHRYSYQLAYNAADASCIVIRSRNLKAALA